MTDAEQEQPQQTDAEHQRKQIRAAIREIRREGYKAAFVYATVDAVLALLAANLGLSVLGVGGLPEQVSLGPGAPPISGTAAAGIVLGIVVFAAEFWIRTRRFTAERFETINPEVEEALRTARDAARDEQDNPMARTLYADVLDRLKATSSAGFVRTGRIALTVALVLVVSIATIQASVAGIDLASGPSAEGGEDGGAGGGGGDGQGSDADSQGGSSGTSSGLQSGGDILGDPEDVSSGTENLTSSVQTGSGSGGEERARSYDQSGLSAGSTEIEAQRAGFESQGNVEDADLIREYNLKIREDENDNNG